MARTPKAAPTGAVININPNAEREDELLDQPDETADDHDFDTFVAELSTEQGRTYESKVYRLPQGYTKENELLFVFRPGEITLTGLQLKVRAEYGPGRYFVRTFVSGIDPETQRPFTQLVKGGTFRFAIGASLMTQGTPGAFNPLAIAGGDKGSLALIEKLSDARAPKLNASDPMIAFMLESSRQQNDLMKVLLLGLLQNRSSGPDPLDQLTKLVTLQRSLGLGGAETEDDDTLGRVLGAAERVLPSLFNAVGSAYGARPSPRAPGGPMIASPRPSPSPSPTGPAIDPRLLANLQAHAELIGKLPMALKFGVDPVAIADQVLEKIGDEGEFEALCAWVAHPQLADAVIAVVPELAAQRPRLVEWLTAFAEAIKGAEVEDEPTEGAPTAQNAGHPLDGGDDGGADGA